MIAWFAGGALLYAAVAVLVGRAVAGSAAERWATITHLVAVALVNAVLLTTVRRRRIAGLASPALTFLVVTQTYMTLAGLKYFDLDLLASQFNLTVGQRLAGSLACEAVVLLCVLLVAWRGGGATLERLEHWLRCAWADVRRLYIGALLLSAGSKAGLIALGYGSLYSGAEFNTITTRSYADLVLFLTSEVGTVAVLALGPIVQFARRLGSASPLLRALALVGVLGEIGYSLLFLKARLLLLTAAVFGMLALQVVRPRVGERLLGAFWLSLPPLSLLGLAFTLAIGRTNIAEETGLRIGITFVNTRADLTDFPTALLVNGGVAFFDPGVAGMALLNGIPRFLLPGKAALVRDAYTELLARLGWAAGSGTDMVFDYQDSIFAAGFMSGGILGLVLLPLAFTALLVLLGNVGARLRSPIVATAFLLGSVLAATHIEMEWSTIVLNLRQGLSYTAVLLVLVAAGRVGHQFLAVAALPEPAGPRAPAASAAREQRP